VRSALALARAPGFHGHLSIFRRAELSYFHYWLRAIDTSRAASLRAGQNDPLAKRVAAVHQEIDSTTAAASRTEPEGQVLRYIHQLPYRRNDNLGDAISGTSRLDLNA